MQPDALPASLLERLADGVPRRREDLSGPLGLDAAALDAGLTQLAAAGIAVVERDGRIGLEEPIEWVDPEVLRHALGPALAGRIESLTHALVLESTNRLLLEGDAPAPGRSRVAIAEYQHGGRGRRGRRWLMPPGAGLALSVSWRHAGRPEALAALSLAAGAVARRAVREVARVDIGLKWPNDLVADGGKLGGILVELGRLADGSCHVVVGIGINVRVPARYLATVSDWQHGARDLAGIAGGARVDRTALAARLVAHLLGLFADYPVAGFAGYRAEWLGSHVLEGLDVEISSAADTATGTVRGVDSDGALIVEDAAGRARRILSGDVSVRIAS